MKPAAGAVFHWRPLRLAERMLADFADGNHGGFFTTATGHEALIMRSREGPDGATPSGNAVAASVLARLSFTTSTEMTFVKQPRRPFEPMGGRSLDIRGPLPKACLWWIF